MDVCLHLCVCVCTHVHNLQRELSGFVRQPAWELCEVDSGTVHCPLCRTSAIRRTCSRLRFHHHCCNVSLFYCLLLLLLFIRIKRGLAMHQQRGHEQHTQGAQDGMLGKGHVCCGALLLHRHMFGCYKSTQQQRHMEEEEWDASSTTDIVNKADLYLYSVLCNQITWSVNSLCNKTQDPHWPLSPPPRHTCYMNTHTLLSIFWTSPDPLHRLLHYQVSTLQILFIVHPPYHQLAKYCVRILFSSYCLYFFLLYLSSTIVLVLLWVLKCLKPHTCFMFPPVFMLNGSTRTNSLKLTWQ